MSMNKHKIKQWRWMWCIFYSFFWLIFLIYGDFVFLHSDWLIIGHIVLTAGYAADHLLQREPGRVIFSHSLPDSSFTLDPISWTGFWYFLAGSMLITALARPQLPRQYWESRDRQGIEIAIALDMSGSMLAMDFRPNRLEAAKTVTSEFILNRKYDKIGLVLFEGQAYLQCPLTSDHKTLIRLFQKANTGKVQPGTAIGAGLATALNALKSGQAKTKIIILITDGVNESPSAISPEMSIEIAKTLGIRVYTIGVGTNGQAKFPLRDVFGNVQYEMVDVKIDEALLQRISEQTNGRYYRATNEQELAAIYADIEALEKDKLKITEHVVIPEKYGIFVVLFLIFFGIGWLSRTFIWKTIH